VSRLRVAAQSGTNLGNEYTRGRELVALLARCNVIIDGAMGTMIQRFRLDEAQYRGAGSGGRDADPRFESHPVDLKDNNDLLSLTQPDVIRQIHEGYLASGADIIETNTFGATAIAQADYGLEAWAYEMNVESARLARQACEAYLLPDRPRFVAGALGPTPRTASISPDVNDPGVRNVTFDELEHAYHEQASGLIEGALTRCWWRPFSTRSMPRQRCLRSSAPSTTPESACPF